MSAGDETREKAITAMKFLRLFFRDGETVYFFFRLIEPVYKEYVNHQKPYIDILHKINLRPTYSNASGYYPPLQKPIIGIPATVGTSEKCIQRFVEKIKKLEDFDNLGYEIMFCPNPLCVNRKLKKTVREIRYLVIESDTATLEEQRLMIDVIKPSLRTVVFTGGKSYHMYIPINPGISNPKVISTREEYKTIWKNNTEKVDIDIPDFNAVLKDVKSVMNILKYDYDKKVLSTDFARYFRFPFFKNHKTGEIVKVIYGNKDCDIGYNTIYNIVGHSGIKLDEEALERWNTFKGINKEEKDKEVEQVTCMLVTSNKTNDTQEPINEALTRELLDNINVKPHKRRSFGTFLEYLAEYENLRESGIPRIGTRLDYHRVMFTAARIFNWSGSRILKEWDSILKIKPYNIQLSVVAGLKDYAKEWDIVKAKEFSIWKPLVTSLPISVSKRKRTLITNLKNMKCPKASAVSSVILKVLYPVIRKAIIPCEKGEAAIQSKIMRDACGCNGHNYRRILRWLSDYHILKVCDDSYQVGVRSKLYYVNAELIIYLMGFKSEDLKWDPAAKGKGMTPLMFIPQTDAVTKGWADEVATTSKEFEDWVNQL